MSPNFPFFIHLKFYDRRTHNFPPAGLQLPTKQTGFTLFHSGGSSINASRTFCLPSNLSSTCRDTSASPYLIMTSSNSAQPATPCICWISLPFKTPANPSVAARTMLTVPSILRGKKNSEPETCNSAWESGKYQLDFSQHYV